MLFDRFVGFAYLYTVLDMPRQIRIVCLQKVTVLCFVNNGKTQHRARANCLSTLPIPEPLVILWLTVWCRISPHSTRFFPNLDRTKPWALMASHQCCWLKHKNWSLRLPIIFGLAGAHKNCHRYRCSWHWSIFFLYGTGTTVIYDRFSL